ncbi:tyrosine-type recombinase/integrase [Streptomyces sp. NPDC092952]|uniref:tyrosine-type recombinase/integrase n=1 Tax=Streptomyces sp. NPDC092952 TaxID=3366018 RepID=UPI00380898B2
MASVVPRKNKAGEITSYQVKWRLGGGAKADWQTERFDDEDAATVFKDAVDDNGQQWPPGWVKGRGYIDPAAVDETRYRFDRWARASLENRTASENYKDQRLRAVEMYLNPTFGNCDIRSTEHFSKATVGAWVNQMLKTKVKRGAKVKLMAPETLRGLHGLLSSILQEAVVTEPPLRDRNPCDLTRLPSNDDHGTGDDEATDEMEFMTPQEVAGLVSCFSRARDRVMVRTAYGSGLRWGEITALAARHVRSPRPGQYEIRVTRAWKRVSGKPWFLGPPKSKAGRRTVEITPGLWRELEEVGLGDLGLDDLVFQGRKDERIRYGTFYERWLAAVSQAKALGLLPEWKYPTFHDLRHSHVAALLSDGHSLTYVQRRLGHESIKTTSDRYGHLLETAHVAALATIDRVMGVTSSAGGAGADDAPGRCMRRRVHVAVLGEFHVPFWSQDDAEETAERWARERGGSVHVEKVAVDDWIASARAAGVDGGAKAVREDAPGRAWVWEMGPVEYAADGSEVLATSDAADLRGAWRWDFEGVFTEEPSQQVVDQSGGIGARTAARAWGRDEDAVRAAFAQARVEALRVAGLKASVPGGAATT